MATDKGFSRKLEGGHETFYEFPCSLCENEDKHIEAIKYCEECLVYLCGRCLQEKHNIFPLNKRHQLVDQSQFVTLNKSLLVSFPTKRCPKHLGELINIFCSNHDVVCCSVCKALEHSSCVKTQHVPDAAKGIKSSHEFQDIVTNTKTFVFDVDKALKDRKADLSRIAKEKQSVSKTIADFRKKVNKYFDDLEKNSLAELNHREQTIVSCIDKDIKYLETTKSKAEDILKKLESFKGDNECDLFVQVKLGLQFVNNGVEKIRAITKTEEKPSIQFEINRNIEEYITSLKSFGSFSSTVNMATRPKISAVPEVKASNLPVYPAKQQSELYVQYSPYKIQKCEKFDIKEKSDAKTCNILSICQLPDDTFLITDCSNEKLKRLDKSLKLLDSVKLFGCLSVCAAGPGQAAVSLFLNRKIQLVSVGKKLTLTGSFTVGYKCRGILYVGDELYVCCGNFNDSSSYCIEVYNNGGQLQRTIPRDQQRLSSVPECITVTDDSQHLVTSLNSIAITMLDLTGNVVNTFSHKDFKWPTGICTDGRGQVFVCGYDSNAVVLLSPKHQKIEVILNKEDGIIYPLGVCYDRKQSRLLVSCKDKNELFSFTMT